MKNRALRTIGANLVILAAIAAVTVGAAFAQDLYEGQGGGGRLEGTWDTQVTIRNCQTGGAIRTFASVGTFMSGGTMIDSTSGVPQALKTPGQGVWRHHTGDTYRFAFKSFTFDPAGNFTGWTIIRHEAVLDSKGNAYTSEGTLEVYNPAGTLVATGCASTTATRFE